ncbi:MAG: hypothetical protein JST00_08980 [Deltaproteobacteria bacterium]|nr:hypothetical protein [Deltaproteobacteria bacterium]
MTGSLSGKRTGLHAPRTQRIAGWCGLVFTILSLAVIPLTASGTTALPALGGSAEGFARWYAEHRTGFLVGNYLGIAAFVPGFVQLAVLSARFRSRDDEESWFGAFVLATGTFTYAVLACSLVVFQVLPFLIDPASPQAMLAMGSLGSVWFALDGLAAVPFLLAVGWATLATKDVLPRGFATFTWVVIVLAFVMSLGGIWIQPAWLAGGGPATIAGFCAFFGWTGVLAVVMLRSAR